MALNAAAGTAHLDDLGSAMDRVLESESVNTVGGLVLALLGRPPEVGDVVRYQGVRVEVMAVQGHGVAEALVSRDEPLTVDVPV